LIGCSFERGKGSALAVVAVEDLAAVAEDDEEVETLGVEDLVSLREGGDC
jgi:hypothetical protein